MKGKRYLIGTESEYFGIGFFTGFHKKEDKLALFCSSIWEHTKIYKTFAGAERAIKKIAEKDPKSECFIVPEEMARIYRQETVRAAKEKAQYSEQY